MKETNVAAVLIDASRELQTLLWLVKSGSGGCHEAGSCAELHVEPLPKGRRPRRAPADYRSRLLTSRQIVDNLS